VVTTVKPPAKTWKCCAHEGRAKNHDDEDKDEDMDEDEYEDMDEDKDEDMDEASLE